MKYTAEWNSISLDLVIKEDEDIIFTEKVLDIPGAGWLVREQGFGFTDMWTKKPEEDVYVASIKAVEKQEGGNE